MLTNFEVFVLADLKVKPRAPYAGLSVWGF
jgi:hypothetical protein